MEGLGSEYLFRRKQVFQKIVPLLLRYSDE